MTLSARQVFAVASFKAIIFAFSICGCGTSSPSGGSTNTKSEDRPTADQVLRSLVEAYQSANAYSDLGVLRLSYRRDSKVTEDIEEMAIQFRRPNLLRVDAYNLTMGCDGKSMTYRVSDEPSGDMDHQFVSRDAPEEIKLVELFEKDNILYHFMAGVAGHPIQSELLLTDEPIAPFLEDTVEKSLLEDQTFDDHDCYRVEVKTEQGSFVLWVDSEDFVLRRFEYPAETFLKALAQFEDVSDLQLVAEFPAASFEVNSDERFTIEQPMNAKVVRYFVQLPPPLPSHLFGKRPDSFHFTDADGKRVTEASLAGKMSVLLWFNNNPACQATLQALEKVKAELKDQTDVEFYAVCTEPSTHASTAQIVDLLKKWKVSTKLVRDMEAFGDRVFGVSQLPLLMVVDDEGVVQYVEVLAQPNLEEVLPVVIKRLRKGDDIAAEIIHEHRQELANYNQALAAASMNGARPTSLPLPEAKLPKRSEPKHLKLTKLWSCDELTAPGNILAVSTNENTPDLFVHDGFRSVVQLDANGQVVKRHVLDLPDRVAISYLRTATDQSGVRYFVACENLGQQFHLFDSEWKRQLSYPPDDTEHGGMRDVKITDLDNDGNLELYVGYWESLGIQQVSLKGKRLAGNRIIPKVLSMTVTPTSEITGWRKLLVTDERGSIVQMNQYLRHDNPITVYGTPIYHLFTGEFTDNGFATYCGLSYTESGELVAVGINQEMEAVWRYSLPGGVYGQIQWITSGNLSESTTGHWLFARPDGSIHFKSDDGEFEDTFYYGSPLTGIAVSKIGNDRLLLVSTEKDVTAFKVDDGK